MLEKSAVAYINLDMASMGPQFGASASPSLKRLIVEAARSVPQARDPGRSVYDEWFARAPDKNVEGEPAIGWLGGGSDHIGFVCHVGVASAGFGGGGSPGSAYHTARDTLTWYRQVVGEDYEPALMIARMTNAVVSRLANAPVIPFDLDRNREDVLRELVDIAVGQDPRDPAIDRAIDFLLGHRTYSSVSDSQRALSIQRLLLENEGLRDSPWFRNMVVATDPTSGYGAWTLPFVRQAVASGDPEELKLALNDLVRGIFPDPEIEATKNDRTDP